MLYQILKTLVSIGIRLYYKEIKVVNKNNLPENGPCIYIANHPNTMMDAWILGYVSRIPIFFMAKATLFSSPLKLKILRSLNMIPINRRGEGQIKGVSNSDSFENCYKILEEKKCLLIFPEGTSFLERRLRELKSGTARIALEAERRNNSLLDLKIIPLGLNYQNAERFRTSVMVHVGQSISVKEYVAEFELNQGLAAKKLTEIFRVRLEQVLINSGEKEEEILIDELHQIFKSKYIKSKQKGIQGEFDLLKKIRDNIEEIKLSRAYQIQEIQEIVASLKSKLDQFEINSDFLDRRFRTKMFLRQVLFSFIFLIIGFPFFLFGVIHNYFQYKLTDLLVPKLTKDVEYYAPISVLLGLLLYPLIYLTFMFVAKHFLEINWYEQLIYFCAMPITGLMAFSLNNYFKHVLHKWRFLMHLFSDKFQIEKLKYEKEKLRNLLFEN
jgi:1-acyl-sn-glycerol-3-phosphate acyltransferase